MSCVRKVPKADLADCCPNEVSTLHPRKENGVRYRLEPHSWVTVSSWRAMLHKARLSTCRWCEEAYAPADQGCSAYKNADRRVGVLCHGCAESRLADFNLQGHSIRKMSSLVAPPNRTA